MASSRHQLIVILAALFLGSTAAETFHFEIDVDSMNCDDPTIYEAHLKSFNLQCLDGFGCDQGAGVLGAAAHVGEHAIPTSVHILVHGCHYFDQYCPEDEFNGFIGICDAVADIPLENEEFCSGFEREGRFAVGIPFPDNLNPFAAVADVESVVVEFTFDELNFCKANFAVTLEEGLVAGLLGLGAPLVGVGVSFLLGASLVMKFLKRDQKQPLSLQVAEGSDEEQEPKTIPKGVKTTPVIAAIGTGGNEDDDTRATYKRMLDFRSPNGMISHAGQMELVRQAHFERLRKTRDSRRANLLE